MGHLGGGLDRVPVWASGCRAPRGEGLGCVSEGTAVFTQQAPGKEAEASSGHGNAGTEAGSPQ